MVEIASIVVREITLLTAISPAVDPRLQMVMHHYYTYS